MSQHMHRPVAMALATIVLVGAGLLLLHSQSVSSVGYAVVAAEAGRPVPEGTALFTYSNASGVLVSQAGVGATAPSRKGTIVVDEVRTRTSIALVNVASQPAAVTLILRDASGTERKRTNPPLVLRAGEHLAKYLRGELFPDMPADLVGSLGFESDQPLAALTLREGRNGYNEPLYATLPVIDLNLAPTSENLIFPQIAVGEGYTTQLLLLNRTDERTRGQIHLTASDGGPLLARVSGETKSDVDYDIAGHGIFKAELEPVSGLSTGYAVVMPAARTSAPGGAAVFRYQSNGQLMSEAGVLAAPMTTAARIFVDQVGTRTGVALANPVAQTANLTLTLMDRAGNTESTATRTLGAGTHLAAFVDELFADVGEGFTGLMEIRSDVPVAPVTLKLAMNSRSDLILTTLPVADLTRASSAGPVVFPQIAIGFGFSTRFLLLNSDTANNSSGNLSFFSEDGTTWPLPMGGQTASRFPYQVAPGGGRQYLPGNTAQVAVIQVIDRTTNEPTSEITINEGNTVRPRLRIRDNAGAIRDDFDPTVTSIDPDIATVNADGSIQGKRAGFATVILTSRRFVQNVTATVVHLESGTSGYAITGIAQDLSRRLYLAASEQHTLLRAQTFKSAPDLYAGIEHTPGLKDDVRLQSQFQSPAFLVLNQADGSLYVSDSANHVIRRVRPGNNGRVETLAGTGSPGFRDGDLREAAFNNPQGIALDNTGNLWIADSGNHTIRRIKLATREVETIAGTAGVSGSANGTGAAARFSSPTGIAVELENPLEHLARERRGDPAPLVHVIIADTGNGRLRRVYENGLVETVQIGGSATASTTIFKQNANRVESVPAMIDRPTEVSVDAVDNIYVTETGRASVRVILRQGSVATLGGERTFRHPTGIVTDDSGRIIVSDSGHGLNEFTYGLPTITSVYPALISARGGSTVVVSGSNFAPDTFVIIGTSTISANIETTRRLTFTVTTGLLSGNTILTVQNRGGMAQTAIQVEPIPLSSLRPGEITTVAGGTTFAGEGAPALAVSIFPTAVVVDSKGNVYFSDYSNHRVRRIDARTGIATTVAGNGRLDNSNAGTSLGPGDNGPAIAAGIGWPTGLAIDKRGNLLIASRLGRVRKVDMQTGIITTVAGLGFANFWGDNGPATSAGIGLPSGIALDRSDNLFITDLENERVRRVDAVSGVITTVAGNGTRGSSGDGGLAVDAMLNRPSEVAVDPEGNLYICDGATIRRVDTSGHITTYATGYGVVSDAEGNLFISEANTVRRVDGRTGFVTIEAGNGTFGYAGDGGPATAASLDISGPIFVDGSGNIWIPDGGRVRKVDDQTRLINTVAGSGANAPLGDGDRAVFAKLSSPGQMAFGADGSLYIADTGNVRLRKVDARTGIISTVAVGEGPFGLTFISGVATDSSGNVYFSEGSGRVRKLSSNGMLSVFAGSFAGGSAGDGGPATAAQLSGPLHLAVDGSGNLFIVDWGNRRIRKVDAQTGVITTVAKYETTYGGDIAVDPSGNVFFNDNYRIRRIDAATGTITTVADVSGPIQIALDRNGNIFFSDYWQVFRIDSKGVIRTVAGQNRQGFSGDGGPAAAALLDFPQGLAFDNSGNLYIADFNDVVRVVKAPIP